MLKKGSHVYKSPIYAHGCEGCNKPIYLGKYGYSHCDTTLNVECDARPRPSHPSVPKAKGVEDGMSERIAALEVWARDEVGGFSVAQPAVPVEERTTTLPVNWGKMGGGEKSEGYKAIENFFANPAGKLESAQPVAIPEELRPLDGDHDHIFYCPDEQQCDGDCRQSHRCGICTRSWSECLPWCSLSRLEKRERQLKQCIAENNRLPAVPVEERIPLIIAWQYLQKIMNSDKSREDVAYAAQCAIEQVQASYEPEYIAAAPAPAPAPAPIPEERTATELCLREDCDSNHICFNLKGHSGPCYKPISEERTAEMGLLKEIINGGYLDRFPEQKKRVLDHIEGKAK